mgnify:FL=1
MDRAEVNQEWVKDVSNKLEVLYKLLGWTWHNSATTPSSWDIQELINRLFNQLTSSKRDFSYTSGGITVYFNDDGSFSKSQPIVSFRIDFDWNDGAPYNSLEHLNLSI